MLSHAVIRVHALLVRNETRQTPHVHHSESFARLGGEAAGEAAFVDLVSNFLVACSPAQIRLAPQLCECFSNCRCCGCVETMAVASNARHRLVQVLQHAPYVHYVHCAAACTTRQLLSCVANCGRRWWLRGVHARAFCPCMQRCGHYSLRQRCSHRCTQSIFSCESVAAAIHVLVLCGM